MSTPASVAKHPIHPMLIVFPAGLFVFSLICDLVYIFGSHQAVWSQVALYTMGGGIIGALLAAVPGFIDFLSITERDTKSIAWKHMLVNVSALVIFIVNFWIRVRTGTDGTLPIILSVLGVLLFAVGGWLGGEMVYVKGVGVESEHIETPAGQQPMRPARSSADIRRAS